MASILLRIRFHISSKVFLLLAIYHFLILDLILILNFFSSGLNLSHLPQVFTAWDAHHYLYLSEHGYQLMGDKANYLVFFPFYPLILKLFSFITPWPLISALLVNAACSIAGHYFFFLWLIRRGLSRQRALKILILFMVSPIAVYFNSLYSESLFLLETSLFFLLLSQHKFKSALIVGIFASATRNVGFLLFIPYLFAAKNKFRLLMPLFFLGPFIYLLINYYYFGSPFKYAQFLSFTWYKSITNPISTYLSYLPSLTSLPDFLTYHLDIVLTLLLPFVILFGFFRLIRQSTRTYYFSDLGYIAVQWLIFTSQSYWLSNTRYIAMILPLYLILEDVLHHRPLFYGITFLLSLSLCSYGIWLYAKAGWIY